MTVIDDLITDAHARMTKSVASARNDFSTLRTGRANASLLDRVMVQYYGTITPLKQLASIGVPEPRLLTVTPFDKTSMKDIERGITESDLGLNPSNDGQIIRLPIPELTKERRKEMVKMAGKLAEDGKIAVRGVRRDVMSQFKDLTKSGDIGEDEARKAETELQKATDAHIAEIDHAVKSKEAEIMEV